MSKEATIIQTYNDEKRIYEYFVKGFDVSESIRVLLKAHKDAYDNERRVFAECKGYCEAEKEFKDRITDLEAKLVESKNALEAKECVNRMYKATLSLKDSDFSDLVRENAKLKQQLAEKEKEIESLRENSLSKRIFKEKLIPSHCMEQYEKYEQQIDKLTQDKISFAVEKLKEVKARYPRGITMWSSDDTEDGFEYVSDFIDNQIEQLKKEMKQYEH